MKLKRQSLARRFRAAKFLVLWSWYWVPMCIAYGLLRGVSWIGDKAYYGAEWINAHPPLWDRNTSEAALNAAMGVGE